MYKRAPVAVARENIQGRTVDIEIRPWGSTAPYKKAAFSRDARFTPSGQPLGKHCFVQERALGEHWSVQGSGLWPGSTVYTERAAIREHCFVKQSASDGGMGGTYMGARSMRKYSTWGSAAPYKRAAFGRGARFTPNGGH